MTTMFAIACAPVVDGPFTATESGPAERTWTLEPIWSVDGTGPDDAKTDVFFPMRLFDDTASGFWGTSGSSWLHFGATGELIDRFDRVILESPWVLTGMDAVTPTRIAVGAVWSDGDLFGDIVLLDTITNEQTVLLHQDQPIGNLAVFDGTIVFVSYRTDQPHTFTVSRISVATGAKHDLATLEGSGATADVALGVDGRVYVASNIAKVTLDEEGTVLESIDGWTANPHVAINRFGDLIWIGSPEGTAAPFRIDGGSSRARAAIEENTTCDDAHLSLIRDGARSDLAALCQATGVTWVGDKVIVVSVGTEDGAPLVEVIPPLGAGR